MTNLNKILILGLSALLVNIVAFTQNTQTILSEYWNGPTGQIEAPIFSTLVTKTDDLMNVYVAGATLDPNTNKLDLMIQKFNRSGSLLWQRTYGGALNEDDMAADVFIDDNYDVYVTGSVAETSQNFYDLVVIKYKSNGQFIWDYFYNYGGSPVPYDAGTAITGDNDGHIYVTGSSAGNNSGSDYVIIKLTSLNGNEVWTERYDYDGLDDIPAKIELNSANDKVTVSGGSQFNDNPVRWEMAMVVLDSANQAPLEELRTGESVSSGVSEVYDMTTDANDNIYIVGTKKNTTTDYDITVYKLDDELNLIWEETYDGYGEDDRGKGIKVDDQGNVYVVGYVTTLNEGKNYSLLKYDLNGNLDWSREYNGMASQDDEAIQLVITDDSKIVVTGSAVHGSTSDFVTLVYNENGEIINEISFNGAAGLNDTPTNMAIDLEGNIIVVGQTQTGGANYDNITVKYTMHEKVNDFSNGINNAHELIIRFDTSAIIYSAIDKKNFFAGILEDFVKQNVLDTLYQKTGFDWSKLETHKIFRGMTTADTISETRLGELHRIDDFWATLSVFLPKKEDEGVVIDSLNKIHTIVHYAELNYLVEFFNQPDDPLYVQNFQSGLHSPIHGIEVESAWSKQVGQSYTKVGVYDTGINWRHVDFQHPTTGFPSWANSKIVWGYDFWNFASTQNQTNPDIQGHGTAVAGIIGALRNNNKGIAGIAGGRVNGGNNTGASLYSIKIRHGFYSIGTANIAATIVDGAVNITSTGYGLGLDIQNHSWGTINETILLKSAVKTAFEESCTLVVGSGNNPSSICSSPTCVTYPSSYNDEFVIKVGANDASGDRAGFSVHGNNLDVIAPGTPDIYTSLDHDDNSGYSYHQPGTSFAAPHVAGVAALFHSEHHVNNGYPNNLAPEDVEYFLENFATTPYQGYDQEIGFGRVNASLSLEKLSFPDYYVLHGGGQSSASTSVNSPEMVIPQEPMYGLSNIPYLGERTEVNYAFVEVLPIGQTIIDAWPRFSSSKGFDANTDITNASWFDMNVSVNQNVISVSTTTYCWYIIQELITFQPVGIWIPSHPSELKTSYSLYVEDPNSTASMDEENLGAGISVYPNPSNDQITIDYNLSENTDVQLEIIDATGRKIATHEMKNQAVGKQSLTISVSHLANGIYFCTLNVGEEQLTRKIIKN